jgi:hypothetical protein
MIAVTYTVKVFTVFTAITIRHQPGCTKSCPFHFYSLCTSVWRHPSPLLQNRRVKIRTIPPPPPPNVLSVDTVVKQSGSSEGAVSLFTLQKDLPFLQCMIAGILFNLFTAFTRRHQPCCTKSCPFHFYSLCTSVWLHPSPPPPCCKTAESRFALSPPPPHPHQKYFQLIQW